MKKLTISLALLFFGQLFVMAASNIACVTKHDGRLWWYDRVWIDPAPELVCQEGFMLNCYDPGWSRCRLGNAGQAAPSNLDGTDVYAIDRLIQYSEEQADSGKLNGTHSIVIQVNGEPNPRTYYVDWDLDSDNDGTISVSKD